MEEKLAFLEEVFDTEEGSLTPDMLLDDIEEWDSLTRLSLMAEAKRKYSVSLTASQIRGFKTIGDICNMLQG